MESWNTFLYDLEEIILPIYQNHEFRFDKFSIHGRMHIARALLFGEFMTKYYKYNFNYEYVNSYLIRYAIAFHDSGRENNGIDYWELKSAQLCKEFLSEKPKISKNDIEWTYNLIAKKTPSNCNILYDSDVLEIMRPCCGHGGRDGFNEKYLIFLSKQDKIVNLYSNFLELKYDRFQLIKEAWNLIYESEQIKYSLQNHFVIHRLLDLILSKKKYKLLKQYLKDIK